MLSSGTKGGKLTIWVLAALLALQTNAQVKGRKVVMISLDGTPDYMIDKFLANGVLSPQGAFAKMKRFGAYAETVHPINVASTGPSHISIFTGASPGKTGMVGNTFRKSDQAWKSPALSAFRQPILQETIFQAAIRQGKKVMTFGGVGIDYTEPSRMTDYMHMYPLKAGPSLVIDLFRTDSLIYQPSGKTLHKLHTATQSPSNPVYEITGVFTMPLYLYLTDTTLKKANELHPTAQIIIDTDSLLSNGYSASLKPGDWTVMAIERNGKQYNTSFRILLADEISGKYRLFMSAPEEIFGYPNEFLKKIQSSCGLWPGEPENRKQTTGLIPEEIWFEQVDRLAKYSRDMILTGLKENNFDLLFGYFSTLDDVQHRYTLTNPRQLDYSADNGTRPKAYGMYIEKWFQTIDRYLLEIINAAPKGTDFVIFSDHGMIPIHTCLLLNNYFEQVGFSVSQDEITCVSSGNAAHIYINKEKIKKAAYDDFLSRLTRALKSLKDSVTGEQIFKLIATKEDQKGIGLYNPDYSGDLFVSCIAGYTISDRLQAGVNYLVQNSFDPALFGNQNQATKNFLLTGTMNETGRAVHGCLSIIREGQSIFYSIGPDVPKKKINTMSSLQIAATVAKLLEIHPPTSAEGKSIF